MANIFGNEIIIKNTLGKNKLESLGNEKERKKIRKEINMINKEKSINIFNLIFKINSIKQKEIIINQYDISGILEPFLEDKKFLDLINLSVLSKTKIEIPKYWSKLLNLSFIYSTLKFRYLENYTTTKEVGKIKLNKDY